MKISRASHDPAQVLGFYEEGLSSLGALCERTWYDRLEVVAEGAAAALWNGRNSIHEVELHFAPANAVSARDASRDVFPGCPLTFHLAEALRGAELPLERFSLASDRALRPPDPEVAEKRWRAQFADTAQWRLTSAFKPSHHFSILALVRCEIQAIDQHWSLHRIAMSLPSGGIDDSLAQEIDYQQSDSEAVAEISWPPFDPEKWRAMLGDALALELRDDLDRVRTRQENSLRRELERIDEYFFHYRQELLQRGARSTAESAKAKTADRLAASDAEHTRRRSDQIARHEIRIVPHIDALFLIAEAAWQADLSVTHARRAESVSAHFIPRSRRWEIDTRVS